jgi:hypothetical protein
MKQYKKKIAGKSDWGASTYLAIAEKANSELLKYIYPQRKAVEGEVGKSLTFAQLIQIISGEEGAENDSNEE